MIVMKFGGTSVGSAKNIQNVARIIQTRASQKPVVVVSAVAGITDKLIELSKCTAKKKIAEQFEAIVNIHVGILHENKLDESLCDGLFNDLRVVLSKSFKKSQDKERLDSIVSFGERFSARIVAAQLCNQGTTSKAFDAWEVGMITTNTHCDALPLPDTPRRIAKSIKSLRTLPVVTGFIGKTRTNKITTLGRGGSDYSTAVIGAAINAERIEIWKEVDGVLSTDPRIVPQAKLIPIMHYEEASELAYFGAKVLHPRTMQPAVEKNIPVVVLNTFNPANTGTTIQSNTDSARSEMPKAVTARKNVSIVTLHSPELFDNNLAIANVFTVAAKEKVQIDVVATSVSSISVVVPSVHVTQSLLKNLRKFGTVDVSSPCAVVCIVGLGMKTAQVMQRIGSALESASISAHMIVESATGTAITCVVAESDSAHAVKALHTIIV